LVWKGGGACREARESENGRGGAEAAWRFEERSREESGWVELFNFRALAARES